MTAASELGRPPHNPWRAITGAKALAPSRVWLQGVVVLLIWGRGAHLSFNPTNCWPISDRSHPAA